MSENNFGEDDFALDGGGDPDETIVRHPTMAFPIVKSNGGPFDDVSFGAGWNLGSLSARLSTAASLDMFVYPQILESDLSTQVDLIAMQFGFSMETEPHPNIPGYTIYSFFPSDGIIPGTESAEED